MISLLTLAVLASVDANSAVAENWPTKATKMKVQFGAGGTADQLTRTLNAMAKNDILGQPLTIINVGGHCSIGTHQGKEADPDGYNFVMGTIATMGSEASGQLDFSWRDFEPVAATGAICTAPLVGKGSGIKTVDQLLTKPSRNRTTRIVGANLGATSYMVGIMLERPKPDVKFRFVRKWGGASNFQALTGGQTAVSVLSSAEVVEFALLPDGAENPDSAIHPLATIGGEHNALLGDLPTLKELGYDVEFCITNWWFAQKDTAQEAIHSMANALEAAVQTPEVQNFYGERVFSKIYSRGTSSKRSRLTHGP
ncbi:Tripartite tricarboxylate transporter family receptor [Marinovum algicola]|uniref:Tripartite-type tricarboxylate transporter, receptor component TctC n=1 Tax=Marinovum algicola TaxID=42444 RepID=A0A975WFF1_9RHOB|nr:tripartite tricarboxylate transporter substrate-binding protein [Marinovum algicola]SEK11150.1 Tripartite-type tricarboxylate transporter, receptor component TctC [Marinovum algicola]SLN71239.1 Tripartite tricarboxylate transporter family receptor [Marinovum algicola]